MAILDKIGLERLWHHIVLKLNNKVDKVDGKDLSTNDYTTGEKNKLAGIAEGANKTVVDGALSATSANPVQNKVVNDAISSLNILVGDTAVSAQINVAIQGNKPRIASIVLSSTNWTGDTNPWSQVVTINGATANSKIDLQPTAAQIVELQDNDIALIAENDDGVVTVYAIGSKPTVDYTMQALITEVVAV